MKMEPIVSSETSAIRTQTPGNYPKRNKLSIIVTNLAQCTLLQFCAPTKPGGLYRPHCFSLSNVHPSYIHSLSYPPALHSSHDLLGSHIFLFCLSILLTFPAHRNIHSTTLTTPDDLFIYHTVLRYVIFILTTYPAHRIFLCLTAETRTAGLYKPRSHRYVRIVSYIAQFLLCRHKRHLKIWFLRTYSGVVTGIRAGQPGVRFPVTAEVFYVLQNIQLSLRPTHLPVLFRG